MNIIHLNSPWFELVKHGKKIYEGRRNTSKLREICKKGNVLTIKHYTDKNEESYEVIIEDIIYCKTYEDAFNIININDILPIENITIEKGILIYQQYVSLKTQIEDGIIMIKIKII